MENIFILTLLFFSLVAVAAERIYKRNLYKCPSCGYRMPPGTKAFLSIEKGEGLICVNCARKRGISTAFDIFIE